MERKCILAVRRDICWAPYNIINNWNQVEAEDCPEPPGKTPAYCDDLMGPRKKLTGLSETTRRGNAYAGRRNVQCLKMCAYHSEMGRGWASLYSDIILLPDTFSDGSSMTLSPPPFQENMAWMSMLTGPLSKGLLSCDQLPCVLSFYQI